MSEPRIPRTLAEIREAAEYCVRAHLPTDAVPLEAGILGMTTMFADWDRDDLWQLVGGIAELGAHIHRRLSASYQEILDLGGDLPTDGSSQ
jgi:hypothetical protein